MQRFYVNDFRKWLNKLRKSQWQLKAIVCLQSLVHDRSQLWIASNSSLCLGRAHSIWLTSSVFPWNIPYWVLSVPELWERWIRGAVPVWWFVCWRNMEGDDGSCPRSSEPRDNRRSRADSILALPLCSALPVIPYKTRSMCPCSQLKSCILLEAFRNCQRGKADVVCSCSFPRNVILHYCITVLKAKNEKSQEWVSVTFVKNAMGRSNLLSSVNTAGFG